MRSRYGALWRAVNRNILVLAVVGRRSIDAKVADRRVAEPLGAPRSADLFLPNSLFLFTESGFPASGGVQRLIFVRNSSRHADSKRPDSSRSLHPTNAEDRGRFPHPLARGVRQTLAGAALVRRTAVERAGGRHSRSAANPFSLSPLSPARPAWGASPQLPAAFCCSLRKTLPTASAAAAGTYNLDVVPAVRLDLAGDRQRLTVRRVQPRLPGPLILLRNAAGAVAPLHLREPAT